MAIIAVEATTWYTNRRQYNEKPYKKFLCLALICWRWRCDSRTPHFCDLEIHQHNWLTQTPGGGHSTFFQVGVCGPDFWSLGLANGYLPLKRGACELKISKFGGLWAESFQIWRLVSSKFSNLGAWELKFGQKRLRG